ncbi:MAG TPA: hypothetical protein VGL93_35870 [Streptosporangiaceae bacterium]|jgi:hypothetical protein
MTRRGNGLTAAEYTPLADLSAALADAVLAALKDAGVAAYIAPVDAQPREAAGAGEPGQRLYVDAAARGRAERVLMDRLPGPRDAADAAASSRADGTTAAGDRGGDTAATADRTGDAHATSDRTGDAAASGEAAASGDGSGDAAVRGDRADDGAASGDASDAAQVDDDAPGRDDVRAGTRDEEMIWQELIAGFDADAPDTPSWPDRENIDDASPRITAARIIRPAEPPLSRPDSDPSAGDDSDAGEEGHYIPPPPPPLPRADPVTKFAWIALAGGPLYLLLTAILQWEVPGWAAFAAVAAFVGGFVTLVLRMGDERHDDGPDDGAVV